jgi:hypothetical protein
MFRVVLQDGHDEHKPLEIWKLQHSIDFKMSAWVPQDLLMSAKMAPASGE